ncbi:hypothetical protein [Polluticaenibacter yanchengensis]|uniref:Uncharacterized protein n=1 Tax=Polluticaenibacter yanchengensis TaxID=3014562 RepID=A0ABT4UQ31_9BACT|nr:hypothetical protein [Chitinophagaceae bacterium LY-5]
MCTHYSYGVEITNKITTDVYPYISCLVNEVIEMELQLPEEEQHVSLLENVYLLKSEFDSLKNYEEKLIFPSVLKVFNSKDNPAVKPTLNLKELEHLTQHKELAILKIINNIQLNYHVDHKSALKDILDKLIHTLQGDFVEVKNQWRKMLSGWNAECPCFQKATDNSNSLQ